MSEACYFFDTSALFKRYITEAGTDKIDLLFENKDLFIISSLTVIELVSNLKRMAAVDRVINDDVCAAIKSEFFNDIANGIIKVEPVSSLSIVTAVDLLSKCYISPIDSIQLAMALNLKGSSERISFVCSDKKLCKIAEKERIDVIRIE